MKLDLKQAMAKTMADFDAQFPLAPPGATGPRSEAGKQRTRLNAYKHGLTGQIHLFTPEEHGAFERHCQSIVAALAPVGVIEQELAQSIAEDKWRLNRIRAIESGIFALGRLADESQPGSLQNDPREIDRGLSACFHEWNRAAGTSCRLGRALRGASRRASRVHPLPQYADRPRARSAHINIRGRGSGEDGDRGYLYPFSRRYSTRGPGRSV
jgi:hypothetical protein